MNPIHLNGREYKLLLKPIKFRGKPSVTLANNFWNRLKPIIEKNLDKRASGRARSKGRFDLAKVRGFCLWDSKDHVLASCELTLRQRGKTPDPDGPQEITLKLRTSDLFISAFTAVTGSSRRAKTKLEEDIAPLQVQLPRSHPGRKVVANYDATNSRFSRSTTQPITADKIPCTLAQACKLFPSLKEDLMRRGLDLKTRLVPGPAIEEHVFKGPTVEFGSGITGEFAFTLWYRRTQRQKPQKKLYASEISFRCNTDNAGLVGLPAARRAHLLFVAMQKKLTGWVDTENSSKTALALP